MTPVTIAPLDASTSPEVDLRACHEMWTSVSALEFPSIVQMSYEAFLERVALSVTHGGEQRFLVAWSDGVPLGMAFANYPVQENTTVVTVVVRVSPDARRRGIGTALLAKVVTDARLHGCKTLRGERLLTGGPGFDWAQDLGSIEMERGAYQSLTVADVDPAIWEVQVPAGFRLESWLGAAPESIVGSFAKARTAIQDAPQSEDSEVRRPEWTVARVRENERMSNVTGEELRVVVAVNETTGEIVALTETAYLPSQPSVCYQLDTAVLGAYRGNGLGRCLKAAMMRWLTADRPQIGLMTTQTDANNKYMIEVNRQVGYVLDYVAVSIEADISQVEHNIRATTSLLAADT